jgi:hypothetical protein
VLTGPLLVTAAAASSSRPPPVPVLAAFPVGPRSARRPSVRPRLVRGRPRLSPHLLPSSQKPPPPETSAAVLESPPARPVCRLLSPHPELPESSPRIKLCPDQLAMDQLCPDQLAPDLPPRIGHASARIGLPHQLAPGHRRARNSNSAAPTNRS